MRRQFELLRRTADADELAMHALALKEEGIVRRRGKIEAVINNAQRARELVEREGSLAAFFWRYAPEGAPFARPPVKLDVNIGASQDLSPQFDDDSL